VSIIILNVIYQKLAVKLVDWENHRTQTEYANALITKTFLFQFINSYFTLFYIAFFKSKYPLCIFDECRQDTCVDGSCFDELSQQLFVIFGAKALALQIVEVILPLAKYLLKKWLNARRTKKAIAAGQAAMKKPSHAEAEAQKPAYSDTFDDYNELVIQFGFVILFVSAFPLAPFLAFASNCIEIRVDGFKILALSQRPSLGKAADIGTWYRILEILSVIGVVTNAFILGFTSDAFARANQLSITQRMWFVFISEHAVLLIKFIIAYIVPDTPGSVIADLAKAKWIKECKFAKFTAKQKTARQGPAAPVHAQPAAQHDQDAGLAQAEEFDDEW